MQEQNLSRFFGGEECGFNSGLLIVVAIVGGFFLIIIILLLMVGDDLIEWIACNPEMLIWIIILVLLFSCF